MKPKVLVTGATGFAGSHMMDVLLQAGYDVRVLVRTTSNLRWIPRDRVQMVSADVREASSLIDLVAGVQWIFHFGGVTRARSAHSFFRVNTEGTKKLAAALIEASPEGALFVFCSSLAASGPAPAVDRPRKESDPPHPISPYGESKLAAERWLDENLGPGTRLLTVRPPAIYGPRDEAILSLFHWVERGWLPLPSQQHSRVSLVHARDLAEGCLALAEVGASGTFHLCDGGVYSWAQVGQAAGRALGKELRPLRIPSWLVRLAGEVGWLLGKVGGRMPLINRDKVADILQPYWICESEKARRQGYAPQIGLSEGVLQTIRWYQTQGWL